MQLFIVLRRNWIIEYLQGKVLMKNKIDLIDPDWPVQFSCFRHTEGTIRFILKGSGMLRMSDDSNMM